MEISYLSLLAGTIYIGVYEILLTFWREKYIVSATSPLSVLRRIKNVNNKSINKEAEEAC